MDSPVDSRSSTSFIPAHDRAAWEPPEQLNLADWLLDARVREGNGDRVALRLDAGDLTYHQLLALANRAAHALARRGVQQEERVVLALPDGADYVATLFGI